MLKKISSGVIALALVCFFMPWIDVSCAGAKVATLTGMQLATGTTVQQSGMFGSGAEKRRVDSEPLAAAALLVAIGGLVLSFLQPKIATIGAIGCSGIGTASMLLLKFKIDGDVARQTEAAMRVDYLGAFWLVLLCFVVADILLSLTLAPGRPAPAGVVAGAPPPATQAGGRFCTACGTPNTETSAFCAGCGSRLA